MGAGKSTIKAIRGMNDLLPIDSGLWQHVETVCQEVAHSFGYQHIRTPIVEQTPLFKRAIGEVTDIVEKEMYSFEDRNGDSLTLRPEGTASCMRAAIENGLTRQAQRLWYMGPMFRRERPQRGRYRQFYQFGVEALGINGPDIDAELIAISARLWQRLGIADQVSLQLNTLGDKDSRHTYKIALVAYFTEHHEQLDEDSKRRLTSNPLRILDSKNPDMASLINNAPSMMTYLSEHSKQHFEGLQQLLDAANIAYTINPRLVRGLDYYTNTVFEWVTESLGAQGTVLAGGRFDGLVEQLGGQATPAIGFAMGIERLILLIKEQGNVQLPATADAYILINDEAITSNALQLTQMLRQQSNDAFRLMMHCGGGSLKSQFKRADRSGARIAIIIGEQELQNNSVSIKYLREDTAQHDVAIDALNNFLNRYFKGDQH